MKRKSIPFPADYDNDTKLRREHRTGVVLVWLLVLLIVVLATVAAALSARGAGMIGKACLAAKAVESLLPEATATPAVVPDVTAIPTPGVDQKPETTAPSEPETTKAPAAAAPTFEPDPDFTNHLAEPYDEDFASLPDVIEAVAPGVVSVFNWQTYTANGKLVEWGSGTGFLITTNGYILTNAHVVEDAEKVTVTLYDGSEYEAVVVGADRWGDTAVLKIDAEGLTALPKGDSDAIRVGESVFAIGDPVRKELSGSVSRGIISAKDRSVTIDGITNTYIQTDAAINFGNSGGPLLDMQGYVVGMIGAKTVTAGYDSYGNPISAEGIGYVLPINRVWEIATQIITAGGVQKPGVGITITQLRAEYAEPGAELRPYISKVTAGGPADTAGLKVGDVILAVDGMPHDDYSAVVEYIGSKKVGDSVVFTIERDGQQMDFTVTIGDLNRMK